MWDVELAHCMQGIVVDRILVDVGLVHCMQGIVVGRLHVGCGACALHAGHCGG